MREYLDQHPQVRTALRVFVYAFLSVFGLTLFDFLNDVREWAEGDNLPFPDVSVLAKAAAAAVAGAVSSVLAVIWNKLNFTPTSHYVDEP
jgi:hypothetical protein